jgi:hypothetical protein
MSKTAANNSVYFWTDESNFESVKSMLKSEFGLVPPQIADEEREKNQLVWEDKAGVGRYRVNFRPGQSEIVMRGKGDSERVVPITGFIARAKISFRYWAQRLDDSTIETDPMREAYLRTYEMLRPVIVTDALCLELNLDKLVDAYSIKDSGK